MYEHACSVFKSFRRLELFDYSHMGNLLEGFKNIFCGAYGYSFHFYYL
jgi:hypothetical protein